MSNTSVQGASVAELRSVVAERVDREGGQEAFARKSGWSQAYVSKFVRGQAGLTARKAQLLGRAFPDLKWRLAEAILNDAEEVAAG